MGRVASRETRLPGATSSLAWNASRDGASTTSLGNPFQCVTTLCVKNFLLPQLKTIPPCPLTINSRQQSFPILLIRSLQVLQGHSEVSPEPSLLQAKQARFPQAFFLAEVLQPSDHLCGPPLDPLYQLHVLLVLATPGLDPVLRVGPHRSQVEGDSPITSLSLLPAPFLIQPGI